MEIPKNVPILDRFSRFQNNELFRCHWRGLEKVEQKSIRYVFVQAKDVFGQKFKIINFFDGSEYRNVLSNKQCPFWENDPHSWGIDN